MAWGGGEDMPEPLHFPSLGSGHRRFLWTKKEVDLAPHPDVGLILLVGDAGKLPQALGKAWILFF